MATGWRGSYFRYRDLFLNISALYKKRADLRAFLEIVLSIVSVIIFLMFALKPTALTIINLVQQIKEGRATLAALNQKLSDLQKAESLIAQNANYINDINIAVASQPSPDTFAKQIQALAVKNGVSLAGLSVNDITLIGTPKTIRAQENTTPLPEKASEMDYSISVRGNFVNINNFIKDLENMRLISVIDNLTISSSSTDTGRVIVAVVSGRVPYLGSN